VGLFDKSIKNKNINNVGKSGRVCQNTTQKQKEKKRSKGENI
jgi:hypothetical protein